MKIKSQRDFWSGIMFLVVGGGFAIGAFNYSMGAAERPGPGYFPLLLGGLTAIIGAVIIATSLIIETEDGEPIGPWAWRPLAWIIISTAVFGVVLPALGMIITLPLFIYFSSMAGDDFSWKASVINAVVITIGSYFVFIYALSLTIPLWPWFMG